MRLTPFPEELAQVALCAQTDPELFFPPKGDDGMAKRARAICAMCPITAECLAWALTHREDYGIWGGMSPKQRRHLRRLA